MHNQWEWSIDSASHIPHHCLVLFRKLKCGSTEYCSLSIIAMSCRLCSVQYRVCHLTYSCTAVQYKDWLQSVIALLGAFLIYYNMHHMFVENNDQCCCSVSSECTVRQLCVSSLFNVVCCLLSLYQLCESFRFYTRAKYFCSEILY